MYVNVSYKFGAVLWAYLSLLITEALSIVYAITNNYIDILFYDKPLDVIFIISIGDQSCMCVWMQEYTDILFLIVSCLQRNPWVRRRNW